MPGTGMCLARGAMPGRHVSSLRMHGPMAVIREPILDFSAPARAKAETGSKSAAKNRQNFIKNADWANGEVGALVHEYKNR